MYRILLCEDDPNVNKTVSLSLRVAGYEVVSTSLASDAMSYLYRGWNPDILITDIILPPPMSGFELANRALALNATLPVIAITGYLGDTRTFSKESRERVVVLQKPFSRDTLLSTVRRLLDEQGGSN